MYTLVGGTSPGTLTVEEPPLPSRGKNGVVQTGPNSAADNKDRFCNSIATVASIDTSIQSY